MEEIWKDIQGYQGYQVSNLGNVRTFNKKTHTQKHGERTWKNRLLHFKSHSRKTGYRVDLWKDGKPKTLLVHRLVASAFLENLIDTDMTVNHKDGNRFNNNVENLEWLSRADNIKYGFEHEQFPTKKVKLINTENGEEHCFNSYSNASRYLGRGKKYVSCCIGRNVKACDTNGIVYVIQV